MEVLKKIVRKNILQSDAEQVFSVSNKSHLLGW